MDRDEGRGGATPSFERHPVAAGVLCARADAVSVASEGFGAVVDGVSAAHRRAVRSVEGAILMPTQSVVRPVLDRTRDLQRAAEVGGAALMMWGAAVGEFNRGVDSRNASVEGGSTPADRRTRYEALMPQHRAAVARLDEVAGDAARILDDPLAETSVTELWRAGLLPASARGLFDHLHLPKGDGMRRHLTSLVRDDVLPPEVLAMSPADLLDHLKDHPDLAARVSRLDLDDLPDDVPGADLADADDPQDVRRILTRMDPTDAAMLALLYSKNLRNTDGVPFHLRALGNTVAVTTERQRLRRRLTALKKRRPGGDLTKRENVLNEAYRIQAAPREIERIEKRLDLYDSILENDRQILLFRPDAAGGDGHVAELHGSITDRTKNVAVLVPGAGSDLDRFDSLATRGRDFVERSRAEGDGSLAAITWVGGDFPDSPYRDAMTPGHGQDMADDLKAFGDEVRAETSARAGDARITAVGHSYGGTVVGLAERDGLDSDRVLHVASAGMGNEVNSPEDLPESVRERDRYSITAPGDFIDKTNSLGPANPHGADPGDFPGTRRLPAGDYENGAPIEGNAGHSGVFEIRSDAWRNMYRVMTGGYDKPGAADLLGALP